MTHGFAARRERERESALKPPSFPRRVVHTRERERVVEGPWARGPRGAG